MLSEFEIKLSHENTYDGKKLEGKICEDLTNNSSAKQ